MKVARQIASFIGLKSVSGKPAATPQPVARRASTPGAALEGLARQPRQAERPATAVPREGLARPRVDASALRRAASGSARAGRATQRGEESPLPPKALRRTDAFKAVAVPANARVQSEAPVAQKKAGETTRPSRSGSGRLQGTPTASPRIAPTGVEKIVVPSRPAPAPPEGATAQRIAPTDVKKIVLPKRPAPLPPAQATPAPASQNRDQQEATRAGGASPDTSTLESAVVAQPAAPSTSVATPTAEPAVASAGSEDTHGLDGKAAEEVAALGQQINERVDAMHAASNGTPSQALADVLLQQAIALHELALLLSDLMRQLIQHGGKAVVSLTAN